jgi:hypothetical protein
MIWENCLVLVVSRQCLSVKSEYSKKGLDLEQLLCEGESGFLCIVIMNETDCIVYKACLVIKGLLHNTKLCEYHRSGFFDRVQ